MSPRNLPGHERLEEIRPDTRHPLGPRGRYELVRLCTRERLCAIIHVPPGISGRELPLARHEALDKADLWPEPKARRKWRERKRYEAALERISKAPLAASGRRSPKGSLEVMQAVGLLGGGQLSYRPPCCCPVLRDLVGVWNDHLPVAERDRLLKPIIPALAESRATVEVEEARAMMVLDWLIRTWLSAWLSAVPAMHKAAARIRDLPPITEESAAATGEIVAAALKRTEALRGGERLYSSANAINVSGGTAAHDAAMRGLGSVAARAGAKDAILTAAVAFRHRYWRNINPTVARLQRSLVDLIKSACTIRLETP